MLAVLLLIWGGVSGFFGMITLIASRSAIHEIEGALGLLICTVAIGAVAIVEQLKKGQAKPPAAPSMSEPFYK